LFTGYALGLLSVCDIRRLIGFTILAYQGHKQGRQTELIIYCGLALLFQPFFKIALGREIWNIVDVIVGMGLLISIFMKPKESPS
jgi:hypothetical protein